MHKPRRVNIYAASVIAMLLVFASRINLVASENRRPDVAAAEDSEAVEVPPFQAPPSQCKNQAWLTSRGRVFTMASGPNREGSGH